MAKTLADLIEARFGVESRAGIDMPAEGPLARILARRTQRRYTDQPIEEDLLEVLLACAQSASSKSDLQQMSIAVVQEPSSRKRIADLLPAMPWIAQAPVFLVFLGDMRRNMRVCERRGRKHVNNNLDTFFNTAVDAALAMQTFTMAAEAVGLGCCPISHIRNHMQVITDVLGLPPGVFPIAGLCVGWPQGEGRLAMRLPPAMVVHRERYDDGNFEQELEAYDRRRHEQAPIAPASQRHADKFGVVDYCPWSENVSRQLSLPEPRPDFGAFLKSHGFELA
ncbi:MAG: nitroreductase family protein [SAR324 cluster bacterium]|nr:nitroreductase family protein [SAR324 cluster bacterium]MCZ6627566.1 nitroreductase family protein [SAR324 cluster bacterium]MCZ6841494.1 nitroreductase family protein [SAR324 cluster bacterium]